MFFQESWLFFLLSGHLLVAVKVVAVCLQKACWQLLIPSGIGDHPHRRGWRRCLLLSWRRWARLWAVASQVVEVFLPGDLAKLLGCFLTSRWLCWASTLCCPLGCRTLLVETWTNLRLQLWHVGMLLRYRPFQRSSWRWVPLLTVSVGHRILVLKHICHHCRWLLLCILLPLFLLWHCCPFVAGPILTWSLCFVELLSGCWRKLLYTLVVPSLILSLVSFLQLFALCSIFSVLDPWFQ